jgi:hypothetical protein
MQVGMPVQKLPGRLDGDNRGGKGVVSGNFPEECGEGLPDAQGEFWANPSPPPEGRTQDFGEREDFDAGAGRGGLPAPGRTRPIGWRAWWNAKGKNQSCLQEKATKYSLPQASHRTRANPPSGRPQFKNRSTVFVTIPRRGPKVRSNRCSYSRVKRSK